LLHEKTRARPLDLFVCFSSVSSIIGAPQRAHYAAANAFLDALAHERHRLGLPALSVNWGPWRDGGMAGEEELRQLEQIGNVGLDPSTALRALDGLLLRGAVQATVLDADWSRLRPNFEARRVRPILSALDSKSQPEKQAPADIVADWLEKVRTAPPLERRQVLETLLRAEVADVLGFARTDEVPVDQSMFELGMDSFRAVQLTLRLQQHLGLGQSVQFVDAPAVTTLATRLLAAITEMTATESAQAGADVLGLTTYTPGLEAEIYAFSRTAWPTRPPHLIESRWRWMLVESAKRLGQRPRVWLFREKDGIVAHHAAIPVRLQVGSEEMDSGWFVDTMVLEAHRKTATGTQLLVESNTEFRVALSLGQTSEMRKIAMQLGWQQVAPLQTLMLILRSNRVFRDKMNWLAAGIASMAFNARSYAKRQTAGPTSSDLEMRIVNAFDERHDRLWDAVKSGYPCAVRRDASYLNWKYITQPGQDFIRLEWRKGGIICAVAVLALDDPGSIYNYSRALITELVVPHDDSRLVLGVLDGIRRECAARNVDAIVLHLISQPLEKLARRYGFVVRESTRFLLVNPSGASPAVRETLVSPANWLVTMGDSDIDRPWDVLGQQVQLRACPRDATIG
jgi:aryl carrier-like protein